jgi:hypothetical protein
LWQSPGLAWAAESATVAGQGKSGTLREPEKKRKENRISPYFTPAHC